MIFCFVSSAILEDGKEIKKGFLIISTTLYRFKFNDRVEIVSAITPFHSNFIFQLKRIQNTPNLYERTTHDKMG